MASTCRDPLRCLICNSNGHIARYCQVRSFCPSPPRRSSPSTVVQRGSSPLLATSSLRPPSRTDLSMHRPSAASSSIKDRAVRQSRHDDQAARHRSASRRHQQPRSPTPSSRHRHLSAHSRSHSRSYGRRSRSRSRERERVTRTRSPSSRRSPLRARPQPPNLGHRALLRPARYSARLLSSEDIDNEINRLSDWVVIVVSEGNPQPRTSLLLSKSNGTVNGTGRCSALKWTRSSASSPVRRFDNVSVHQKI